MTSAAAFVEGGIQDACDDACSICLEEFSKRDPSTVTNCKHEFHLQCILEWCQRSSQCPMCWQAISLKDPTSQELLQVVERERRFRVTPSRNTTIFHHPTLDDFELQHLPVGVNYPELEEHIIRHLAAAAAAVGRAHHTGRRDGKRRPSAHSHPRFLVFSAHPGSQHSGSGSSSLTPIAGETEATAVTVASHLLHHCPEETSYPNGYHHFLLVKIHLPQDPLSFQSTSWNSSSPNQTRIRPSEFQSFSESLKSRINAVSLRYKESIWKSTRGLEERWFSRNSSMPDIRNEARREASAGIAGVSQMMEHLDTTENSRKNQAYLSHHSAGSSITELDNQHNAGTRGDNPLSISPSHALRAASSLSN